MSSKAENSVQSVERAICILEKLSEYKDGIGVSKISKETGLHKSTVHRLLSTLLQYGYVDKKLEDDNYRLGIRILHLSSAILERIDIRTVSRPYITKLAESLGEAVHLSIIEGNTAIYVDKVESPNRNSTVRMNSHIGRPFPLYCTAAGKVLLSELDESSIKLMIKEENMINYTKNTITNLQELIEEIKRTKINGYAIDNIEFEEGIRCVAAPILNSDGKVAAALSISGLAIHMNEERLSQIIKEMLEVCRKISTQLGYTAKNEY